MGAHTRRSRRCGFESLESRKVLAGNVAAQVVDGDLFITGDGSDNAIEVLGTSHRGEVLVRAAESGAAIVGFYPAQATSNGAPVALNPNTLQPLSSHPTTINGISEPQLIGGVTGDVYIRMHGGSDFIGVLNLSVNGNLVIDTGAGDDGVLLGQFPRIEDIGGGLYQFSPRAGSVGIQGSLRMNLGEGYDRLIASRVFTVRDILVQAGGGDDLAHVLASAATNVSIADAQGNNKIRLDDSTVRGAVTLALGGNSANEVSVNNSSVMGAMGIGTGSLSDDVRFANVRVDGALVINAGAGDDHIRLRGSAVRGPLTVVAGNGDDRIVFEAVRASAVQVAASSGDDQFLVKGSLLDTLFATLGDGADWLNITNSSIRVGSATGGAARDQVSGLATLPAFFAIEFESGSVQLPMSIPEPAENYVPFLRQRLEPLSGSPPSSSGGAGFNIGFGPEIQPYGGWYEGGGGSTSSFEFLEQTNNGVLISFTRTADANLDGIVNDDDVTIVGATYAPGVPQSPGALGDFDFNGFVDDDDVTLLGVLYDPSSPPANHPVGSA